MEEAPNKRNALPSLPDDAVVEILSRLPARSLFCCKCVCRSWNCLIKKNHELMPFGVAGFFYNGYCHERSFIGIDGHYPSFYFLPFAWKKIRVEDCCNGLFLCWCFGVDGYLYVVCNPATRQWKELPRSNHSAGRARLGFDTTASSDFHVFEIVKENRLCVGVDIYSSKTAAWIYKESKWGEDAIVCSYGREVVFVNGCMNYASSWHGQHFIYAVDPEGKTWRKISNWLCVFGQLPYALEKHQGHLCQSFVSGDNSSKVSIWILEDYGTNDKWTLKHTMSVGVPTRFVHHLNNACSWRVAMVHPEWNLIFLVSPYAQSFRVNAYNMDHRKVHVVPTFVTTYVELDNEIWNLASGELLYVPSLLKLESLAEE